MTIQGKTSALEGTGAVVIGRNEGQRLVIAVKSLIGSVAHVVYVDSGSTDGSVGRAQALGAQVVNLDMSQPFSAARARNAGLAAIRTDPSLHFVQFIDGDCEVRERWLEAATAFLVEHTQAAVVCGRRRERYPEASIYNQLIDQEWDTPVGPALSCGGDAMMRIAALSEAGDYNPTLIAGEEPELCVRLRAAGWSIFRIDAEMTWHDADMTRFWQWWTRAKRAGHAYAEGAALHGAPPERHNVAQTRRAILWGFALPFFALVGAFFAPYSLLLLLAFPVQILRLVTRGHDLTRSIFLTLGKVPESFGIIEYWVRRLAGRKRGLIEYK